MTETASPNPPDAESAAARFLQDWTELWVEELRAWTAEPAGPDPAGLERGLTGPLHAVAAYWAGVLAHDSAAFVQKRAAAAAAASDPRDAAIEHLTRRVADLESRIAGLEADRTHRG